MTIDSTAREALLKTFDTSSSRSLVAFSQQAAEHVSTGDRVIVTFPAGGRGYISHPGLWFQNAVFLIPISAPYLISVSFVKNPFGPKGTGTNTTTTNDVYAELWRQTVEGADNLVMRAWAGATQQIDRESAAHTLIVQLNRGDELVLKANSDGGVKRELREVTLTFHNLSA
jgi:hypothetical protein